MHLSVLGNNNKYECFKLKIFCDLRILKLKPLNLSGGSSVLAANIEKK